MVLVGCSSDVSGALLVIDVSELTDMVPHFPESVLAKICCTIIVWRTVIRGNEAQDIPDRHLHVMNLIDQLSLVERAMVVMTHAVEGDL